MPNLRLYYEDSNSNKIEISTDSSFLSPIPIIIDGDIGGSVTRKCFARNTDSINSSLIKVRLSISTTLPDNWYVKFYKPIDVNDIPNEKDWLLAPEYIVFDLLDDDDYHTFYVRFFFPGNISPHNNQSIIMISSYSEQT